MYIIETEDSSIHRSITTLQFAIDTNFCYDLVTSSRLSGLREINLMYICI